MDHRCRLHQCYSVHENLVRLLCKPESDVYQLKTVLRKHLLVTFCPMYEANLSASLQTRPAMTVLRDWLSSSSSFAGALP